jgi:hypothetical protein
VPDSRGTDNTIVRALENENVDEGLVIVRMHLAAGSGREDPLVTPDGGHELSPTSLNGPLVANGGTLARNSRIGFHF